MISSIHLGDVAGQNHVTESHPVYVKHNKEIRWLQRLRVHAEERVSALTVTFIFKTYFKLFNSNEQLEMVKC